MIDALLTISNLQISFPTHSEVDLVAVKNLSLMLHRGEVLSIVGESGSGKSVSMLTLGRLLTAGNINASEITLNSAHHGKVDLLSCSEEQMRALRSKSISYVFQEPMTALHPLFTCGAQVEEAIYTHQKLDKEAIKSRVIELFEEMQLPDPERMYLAYPHELSGGQRQRVMLAMALSNNPELLVADEPTTALDSVLQRAVVELMVKSCKNRKTGLIIISHDIDIVRDFSDQIIVMYKGNVVEAGMSKTLLSSPKHPYTRALIQCRPSYAKRFEKLATVGKLMDTVGEEFISKEFKIEKKEKLKASNEVIIDVSGLDLIYSGKRGNHHALKSLSFSVFKGETLGIVGESGSGKSTLAKVLIKMIPATRGKVHFHFDQKIDDRKGFARKVQMIFQDPYASLNPNLTVYETISEVLKVHRICGRNDYANYVRSLLEEVGLRSEDAEKYPHEFSGGQRQRISIARALAVEPEIIICDESVSALDVSVQAQVLNLLSALQVKRSLTYLFITHDLHVISYLADRILVMKDGRLEELAKTSEIVENANSEYSRNLFSLVNA
jgi:peptide/nickel transport system ATP-binding protein